MSDRLHIDFESRSLLDLTKVGTVIYAHEESTYVWCFAWAFNHEKVQLWEPGQPVPKRIIDHIASGGTVSGFSVQFEFHMWNIVLPRQLGHALPPMTYQQLDCTQARAVVMGLPRSLDALAGALDQNQHRMQKDAAGRRLMLQMARPRFHGPNGTTWWDDPDRRHRLGLYCMQDVEVERYCEHYLRPLTLQHREYWDMDFRMNFLRGIQIDMQLVEQSADLLALAAKGANRQISKLTGGACTGIAQIQGLRDWLATQGVMTDSLDKEHLQVLLDDEDVTGKAREALQLRQDFGKASLAKIAQFKRRTADGRMHGMLLFNGAGPGRWTGQGAQLHNLPRPELDPASVDHVVRTVRNTEYIPQQKYALLEMLYGAVLPPMADAIRGFIVAKPKHKLFVRDFSNIEGRCIARIAGEQWKLDAFAAFDAGRGPDLYKLAVAKAFGISVADVDSYLRQLGKTMELSLGFAGGAPALNKQAKKYGIQLADYFAVVQQSVSRNAVSKAEWGWTTFGFKTGIKERTWMTAEMLKLAWRETNPAIVTLWDKLDEAAISAVREPKKVFTYRSVSFQLGKIRGIPYLMCQLPSGRLLYYPYATWTEQTTPWGAQKESVRFMGIHPITRKWSGSHGRGGLWAENVTQGDAFDFIAAAMLRCENAGFPPVLSIHDENVAEAPESADDELYGRLMAQRPPWARSMPLAVDGFSGPRYAKK